MATFERPSAISASTSRSRGVSSSSGPSSRCAEQLGDDLGVERGAALGDAAHGVDEVAHVGHAVLEQVADARRAPSASSSAAYVRSTYWESTSIGEPVDPPARLERGAHALVA